MDKVLITKYINGKEVKEEVDYIPKKETRPKGDVIKKLKPKKKKKKRNKRKKRIPSNKFYSSREWLEMRYRVLRVYQAKCMCCGRTPQEHGIVVNVDHIKPRSKFPELELDFNNLQVLCRACNYGKSNLDKTDWRMLCNNDIYLIKKSETMG